MLQSCGCNYMSIAIFRVNMINYSFFYWRSVSVKCLIIRYVKNEIFLLFCFTSICIGISWSKNRYQWVFFPLDCAFMTKDLIQVHCWFVIKYLSRKHIKNSFYLTLTSELDIRETANIFVTMHELCPHLWQIYLLTCRLNFPCNLKVISPTLRQLLKV